MGPLDPLPGDSDYYDWFGDWHPENEDQLYDEHKDREPEFEEPYHLIEEDYER